MNKFLHSMPGRCLAVACVFVLFGLASWVYMLMNGLLGTTGLGNIFNWGMLIVVFAFFVGFGAGGQLVASYAVLSKREDIVQFAPFAQAFALGGGIAAAVAVVIDLGNPFHILSMLLSPNIFSPLTWDMVALTAFIVVAALCVVALARDWRSKHIWMGVGAVCAIVLQVVEGLLFATQASRAWWHSAIMPVDFLVVACVCGLALIMVMSARMALAQRERMSGIPATYALAASHVFGRLLFWAVVVHIVLALSELALLVHEAATLAGAAAAISLVSQYWYLYAIELLVPLASVIVLRIFVLGKKGDNTNNRRTIIGCGAAVIVGMFAHRLMLLYPALGGSTLFTQLSNQSSPWWSYPVSTGYFASAKQTFALAQPYVPGGVELLSCLLPLGLFVIFTVGSVLVHKKLGK